VKHPSRLPSLNALRAFEAVGRHLSVAAAAAEIGVTQSAVAQQIRGLEGRLGFDLFERRHRGLAFTGTGRAYHLQVERAFRILHDATAALRPGASGVTISVTPSFAAKWLIPHLPDFTATHPDVDLRILATDGVMSFHADGIDLAVRQGNPPFGASLAAELLFAQEIVAVCTPALLPAPTAANALDGMFLLHDTHDLWPVFLKQVVGRNAEPNGKGLRFNQTSLSIDAALAGQGVALASRFLVANDLKLGRLVRPVEGTMRGDRDFYLLGPRPAQRRAPVDAVWQWLLRQRNLDR